MRRKLGPMLFRRTISLLAGLLLALLLLASPAMAQDAEAERPQTTDEETQDIEAQDAAPTEVEETEPEEEETPPPKPLTEREKRELAAKAREAAELRIEEDMVTMTNLVEALSKNIGQIHYLRTLCFGLNDQKWRDYGQRMMTVEAGDDKERHRQLVRAFNAGYYQEKERHTKCSPKVSVDVAALAENGRHISSMLGDPYRER